MILTFKDYNEQILRPTIIKSILKGMFDDMIGDTLLDLIYRNDSEILKSINKRRRYLQENYA
jgi:hypothetical protein